MKLPHLLFRKDGGVFLLPYITSLAFDTLGRVFGYRFAIHRTIYKRAIFGTIEIPWMESLGYMEIGDLDVADGLLVVAVVEDGMALGLIC